MTLIYAVVSVLRHPDAGVYRTRAGDVNAPSPPVMSDANELPCPRPPRDPCSESGVCVSVRMA